MCFHFRSCNLNRHPDKPREMGGGDEANAFLAGTRKWPATGWCALHPGMSSQMGPFRQLKGPTLFAISAISATRMRWNCPVRIKFSISFCNFHTEWSQNTELFYLWMNKTSTWEKCLFQQTTWGGELKGHELSETGLARHQANILTPGFWVSFCNCSLHYIPNASSFCYPASSLAHHNLAGRSIL